MSTLSLSKRLNSILPEEIDGCKINSDFKVILLVQRILNDEDFTLYERLEDACFYFYVDDRPEEAVTKMFDFMRAGSESDQSKEPPIMDFEFDADEIYADFLCFYGINLLRDDLHWFEFLALFKGICAREGALSGKIQTRFMDLEGLKGKALQDAIKAKERAQIPVKLTVEEIEEQNEFVDEWENIGI